MLLKETRAVKQMGGAEEEEEEEAADGGLDDGKGPCVTITERVQ